MVQNSAAPMPAPVVVLGLGLPVRATPEAAGAYPALEHPAVREAEVLIGGKSQLALLTGNPAETLPIGKDIEGLCARIAANSAAGKRQTVLCSGDPLFFGLGSRLARDLEPGLLRVIPATGSLQAAAACLGLPWEGVASVSLHGRDTLLPLAAALIAGGPVFILADPSTSPATLAAWMLERGRSGYRMHVLENLFLLPDGTARAEKQTSLPLDEAAALPENTAPASVPRVLFLEPLPMIENQSWPFGLPDAVVVKENKLLTKAPVRAAALEALGIEPTDTVWDLGAGSGAISLEAARLAWQGQVFAVECNANRLPLIHENRKRFGAANLEIVEGRMPFCLPNIPATPGSTAVQPNIPATPEAAAVQPDIPELTLPARPRPKRIFIGGGLGGSAEAARAILTAAWEALLPGGRILVNCVLLSSLERSRATLLALGAKLSVTCLHASTSSPLAGDMRLEALSPVFLVLGEKPEQPATQEST